MTLFDTTFLTRCNGLQQMAARQWGRRYLGRRVRTRLAGGTEITGYLDYSSGDDFRYVDWNRCARHDELLSKQYRGTVSSRVYLLIDCSASMLLRTGEAHNKNTLARKLAGGLAYFALNSFDTVVVGGFAGSQFTELRPVQGARNIGPLLEFIEALNFTEAAGDLHASMQAFCAAPRRQGLVVLLSDLMSAKAGETGNAAGAFQPAGDVLRRRGLEPFFAQVVAPADVEPEFTGSVSLAGAGGGGPLRTVIEPQDLEYYRLAYAAFQQGLRRYCARYGLGYAQLSTSAAAEENLQKLIRAGRARIDANKR